MEQDLIATLAALGTPGAAFVAAYYLAKELRAMTTRLLDVMGETVERNTCALAQVKAIMLACQNNGRPQDKPEGKGTKFLARPQHSE